MENYAKLQFHVVKQIRAMPLVFELDALNNIANDCGISLALAVFYYNATH